MFLRSFRTCFLLLTFINITVNGQLLNLFPTLTETARGITEELTRVPLVQDAVRKTGEVVAGTLNVASSLPISIARALGIGHGQVPSLLTDTNIVGLTDEFQADFSVGSDNEDTKLTVEDLIVKYGFPVEKYEVVTEDGYVLAMFRIPGDGDPVFLMHGLLGSADDFVVSGPDHGLAYLLAKEGYDVWLGNARGNKHSRKHLHLNPKGGQFWDFSWHEIGYYDLPAMIDHTLNKTRQNQVKYIGHSQGTTSFFVMASTRPEYNEKIELMAALSPVAFMEHLTSPLVRLMAPGTDIMHAVTKSLGIYEFLPDNIVIRTLKLMICGHGALSELICGNAAFLVAGVSVAQINATTLPVMLSHLPSGGSVKQFAHYGQGVLTGEFRLFDYGSRENIQRYGSRVPPSYPLNKITAPVYLFYSDADWLAHSADVEKLYDRLGNVAEVYQVPFDPFNHLDFLFAKDFPNLIYSKLQKIFNVAT